MATGVEELLDMLYELIDEAKSVPLASDKCIIERDKALDLLDDIKAQAGEVWAFPGRNPAKPRTRQAVWADVKRAAKAFRLVQNVGPHSFRKVYAVELLRRCGDVRRVQRALNHSDCATTMVYVMAAELLEAKRRAKSKSS